MVLSETFGLKRFGSLMGWLGLIFTFGLFFGPLVVGGMFDVFGSYTYAYEACAAASIIAGFSSFLCAAPQLSLWTEIHVEEGQELDPAWHGGSPLSTTKEYAMGEKRLARGQSNK
jgi:MFS family permease